MRNPSLRFVGIATSPGGGEVSELRAEEELRSWLETRLDALGIDPVAYSRCVLSLLRRPDSALGPPEEDIEIDKGTGRRLGARPKAKLPTHGDRKQLRAVVQCLTSAADDKYGVEMLVDELCMKIKELERGSSHNEESKKSNEPKTNLETARDRALKYFAAFPALQSKSIKKFSQRKDKNFATNNKNNRINLHINRARNKKTKMSINIESRRSEYKESFGFAKSMEEREKECRSSEWVRNGLALLEAKFEKLELLWHSIPDAQNTASIWEASNTASIWEAPYGNIASIWAAPTLSIPSGPLWPTDTTTTIFTLPTSDNGCATDTPNQELIDDESLFISQNIDLISIEDNADECSNKDTAEYDINWSDSVIDESSWISWKTDKSLLPSWNPSPETLNCFFPPCKTPIGARKESRLSLEVSSLPEPDEDLLNSERTHFRPIKEDKWADGTTFPVNDTIERIAYRRSESGNLLYLPGSETPYMEYRENPEESRAPSASPNFTLKFRVRQGCDKSVQTDPIRSPSPDQPEDTEDTEENRRQLIWQSIFFRIERIYDDHPIRIVRPDNLNIAEIAQEKENTEENSFALDQLGWVQSRVPLHNDGGRRHSSSFGCHPLMTLRPLTL